MPSSSASSQPRVCFVTSDFPPQIGGVARSAGRLVGYMQEWGWEVHVVTPQADRPEDTRIPDDTLTCMESYTEHEGARVYRVPYHGQHYPLKQVASLVDLLDRRCSFDLFQGYFLPLAYPCVLAAGRRGTPVVASIRGNDAMEWLTTPALPFIEKALERASRITSVSSDLLDRVAVLADIRDRASVIHNGIDCSGFPAWAATPANAGVVGTVGEFRSKKAIPLLLEAYARIPRELRGGVLLVGGFADPAEEHRFAATRQRLELDGEVRLTGFLPASSVREHLQGMGVFVVNSLHDGLPNAMLEAAAVGVPIVATAVGGMRDVLVDGESALLVPPGDRQALSGAIQRVLAEPELAERLSRGAREVARQLSPERERRAWRDLYEGLAGGALFRGAGG